jgi:ribonuclease R
LSEAQPAGAAARKQRGAVAEGKSGRASKAAGKPAAGDVQKSRELKKSLMAGAKGAGKSSGKDAGAGRKPAAQHKKSAPADAAPAPGKPRKRKAKS